MNDEEQALAERIMNRLSGPGFYRWYEGEDAKFQRYLSYGISSGITKAEILGDIKDFFPELFPDKSWQVARKQ